MPNPIVTNQLFDLRYNINQTPNATLRPRFAKFALLVRVYALPVI
jgi:hypothetical protein